MIKKSLVFAVLMLIVLSLSLSSISASANDYDFEGVVNSNLGYFKSNFKSNFTEGEMKVPADVWYVYPLYYLQKIDDLEFDFMIPKYDSNDDLSELGAGDIAKRIMANSMLNKPIETDVMELAKRQNQDGSFFNGFGFAQATDIAWSITALQIAKNNGIDSNYDVNKAIEFLKSQQLADGGFNDFDSVGSVDTTGMVMISLAIVNSNGANEINEQCLSFLQSVLNENAEFVGKGEYDSANSCSQSYGIIGLLASGEDVFSDKWTKNSKNVVDALLAYQGDDGGFWYDLDSKNNNGFFTAPDYYSTYNAMLALCDLQYSNLWVKLAQPAQPITTTEETTAAELTTEAATETQTTGVTSITEQTQQQLSPITGEQPLNPIIIIVLIAAVILIVATVLMKNKK